MKQKRKVSPETLRRLKKLRKKFGLGEFKSRKSVSRKVVGRAPLKQPRITAPKRHTESHAYANPFPL